MQTKAVIFDLDGTLTYTLEDLMLSTNYALRQMCMPERSLDEVRRFVGNGVRRLIAQAVPEGTDPETTERCFEHFRHHYSEHCQDHTVLYPGVQPLLQELKSRGVRMAIVSNKLQSGVDALNKAFFADTVDVAIGERQGIPRKPAPDMVGMALAALGVDSSEAIYVGDSEVDVLTARNAALPCVSVLWGFRDRAALERSGATTFISAPEQLLQML